MRSAGTTLRKLASGSPIPISTTLVTWRSSPGALLREDVRCAYLGLRGESRAEIPGEIRHVGERADAALVHPVHQLARAETLAAELRHECLECRTRQPQQVGALGRCRCHGGGRALPNRADAARSC